ncbi:MAG: hypothetical protein E7455_04855 [Ruminococcaceae bacterium]|nr:hypothetical protein [Oscillospiraceae bacterium]
MGKDNRTIKQWFQQPVSVVRKLLGNSVYRQALLVGLVVILILVLIFAMSAAWYTNVVKTGDLVFQVEQWGFTGNVEVSDVPILAAPGDSGVIGLTMSNTGNDLVAADVSILKTTMSTDMQKRLYFYADTSAKIEDETVERIYLNSQQSYTYEIFSQGRLSLTETVYNDVQIKWCWVYDVLGYYVQGTLDGTTGKVQVTEYLRPVEYKYDEAKTTFDKNGKLLTVDGVTTTAKFLEELSKKDGYQGTLTVTDENWTVDGFYPVSVDANGTGVWVKMLSYSEIEKEIITDTAMGTGEASVEAKARVVITAENVLMDAEEVTSAEQLTTLLAQEGTVALELGENVELDQVTVPAGTRAILNLNGYTITGTADTNTFQVAEGGSLTLLDGEMVGSGGAAVTAAGAEIIMSDLNITGYATAVNARDNKSKTDSAVRVLDCTVETSGVSFFIWGNGNATRTESNLVIENSTVVSDYFAISGNGNPDSWGTDIQVIGSRLEGKWTGIYQPQRESTATISSNSTVIGYTGIAIKAGSLYVIDSTVIGTGAYTPAAYQVSGFTDTGDGIYVEANYGHSILVEVSGNSAVTGSQDQTKAIQIYEPDASNVTVQVYGGAFSTSVEVFLAEGCSQTETDGIFTVNNN